MNIMLDIIGSTMIAGLVILMVFTINGNLSLQTYTSGGMFHIQTETIQLARIFEYDVYKAGYKATMPKILIADTGDFKFKADLRDAGSIDQIEYQLGSSVAPTANPSDRELRRFLNGTQLFISYSVTKFKISYYDRKDSLLATPVSAAWRDSIRAIKISLSLQTPQQVNSSYIEAFYEKIIYPRNLQQ